MSRSIVFLTDDEGQLIAPARRPHQGGDREKMAAVMIPALTRPAGVVRSVALSRLRWPRRSFTFALISSG
jgi:hypothetical protein